MSQSPISPTMPEIVTENLTNDEFHLSAVYDYFKESLIDEGDIDLLLYLQSFKELNKFFSLMGSVFGFVSKDLVAKISILVEYRTKDEINFKTVNGMITYEVENKLLDKKGYVSGSRTLLRIHRALDFIRAFLQYTYDLEDHEATGGVCKKAYEETLAKHHTFLIAKAAKIAMYVLPLKRDLLKKICKDNEDLIKCTVELLPITLATMGSVYDRVDKLYNLHDLQSLP